MNSKLFELYRNHWDDTIKALSSKGLTNPLLIRFKDEASYKKADLRVMIFGQETNGWKGDLGQKSPEELLERYSDFYGSEKCFNTRKHFWNALKDYQNTIKEHNRNISVEFVWNNILKIGLSDSKGHPAPELISLQKKVFPVISEEINILKPDAIIFFTGPKYDKYIRLEWADIVKSEIDDWDTRVLTKIKSNFLPEKTYRTYHPNYLYRQGKQYYYKVKETICYSL